MEGGRCEREREGSQKFFFSPVVVLSVFFAIRLVVCPGLVGCKESGHHLRDTLLYVIPQEGRCVFVTPTPQCLAELAIFYVLVL